MLLTARPVLTMILGAALLASGLSAAGAASDEEACAKDDRVKAEFDEFGSAVSREAVSLVHELPALRLEAAPLLESKQWGVGAMPIGCLFDDPLTGMTIGHMAYMDLHTIAAAKREAEAHGIPPKRLARFVAWWQLPALLHEFEHLSRHRELAARGFQCKMATLETEVLARHAEARALRLIEKRNPGLFAKSRSLEYGPRRYADVLGPYAKGPAGLFEAAREDSPALLFIQDTPHEDMVQIMSGTERVSDIREPRGPDSWENRHNTLRHIKAAINDVCREEFTDPKTYGAYRKALKEMLEEEALRWRRDNPASKERQR